MSTPDPRRPWLLRYRLAAPDATGAKVKTQQWASKEGALHEGQRLFDSGCPVVTLINELWPVNRRFVKEWTRQVPAAGRRRTRH